MISKEKVLKVVRYLEIANSEKSEKFNTGDITKDLQLCDKKKELRDYLKKLPHEELIDLCALLATGRECSQKGVEPSFDIYKIERKCVERDHKNNEYLSNYLIRNSKISDYLRYTISLLEKERSEF